MEEFFLILKGNIFSPWSFLSEIWMVVNSTNQERGYNHCRVMVEVQSKKRHPNFSDEELHAMIAAV